MCSWVLSSEVGSTMMRRLGDYIKAVTGVFYRAEKEPLIQVVPVEDPAESKNLD